jgi:hypothetical protein
MENQKMLDNSAKAAFDEIRSLKKKLDKREKEQNAEE